MEKEPILKIKPELEIKPEKEKKKKPLWKRMKALEEQGWTVVKLEESDPWSQCQTCGEQADWVIDTNFYCNKCMSGKADEFKEAAEEREEKRK